MKTITHAEIQEKMVRHHDPSDPVDGQRYMFARFTDRTHVDDNDVMFIFLDGSPPRGFGIFMRQRKLLILYTTRGRPYEEIEVDDILE